MMFRNLFTTDGIDKLFLKCGYVISSVITIVVNVALIKILLLKEKQERANKMFILLSLSDVIVGIFTIPFTMLLFYTEMSEDIYCQLLPVIIYAIFTPVNFSWTTTVVIAIDRFFHVINNRIYLNYMTDKVIYFVLCFNFIIANLLSLWNILTVKYPQKILGINPFTIALTTLEIIFILVTAFLYIYLLHYVRRKSRMMKGSSYSISTQKSIKNRITKTTAYIFMCLVTCNVTQLVGIIYVILSNRKSNVITRNIIFWTALALYLNSFFNAVILIIRSRFWTKNKKNAISQNITVNTQALEIQDTCQDDTKL